MQSIKALRVILKLGTFFESPPLHVLLTDEDSVIVARCLDFTISSHGDDDNDALKSLAETLKEYILTSIEDENVNNLYDPAHNKYWRMFNEQEGRQKKQTLINSLLNSSLKTFEQKFKQLPAEVCYA
ncbi:hypothetical protein MHK_007742 [Candidatus Magnetomorum sp. HK-1]|nr:hypothetical protein MHK_007742 [Candidatus Magnetomorum sp. HK-1]